MRGQIFVVDLMLALIIVVLAIGLTATVWDQHLQQASDAMEYAKMQQIAIDAATATQYLGYDAQYHSLNKSWCGFHEGGASSLGYSLWPKPRPGMTCVGSTRGTASDPVEVFVCRKE